MKLFEDELFDSVMRKSDLENEIEMMMESAITPLRPFPIPEEDRKNFIEKPFEEIQTKYTLPTSLEKYVKEAENCEELYELLTERYLLDKLGETEFNRLSKDLNKFIQESLETEFSIGAMLPQPGEGGDPSDVEVLAKEEEDDFGDLELESAISYYINDPELEYNFYTEAAVVNAVKGLKEKIVGKVKISTKLYKSMIQRAMLKSKLKVAQKKGTDKKVINDLKQQLIGKEQEIRTLKAGIDPQSIEEIDRIGQKIDKKMEEKEEKEMKAIAEKIISNPNLVASENSEDIEDGNLVTEVFNPFNMIRINCILIAGTWVVLNGLVVGKGAEYIKSKKELRYIEKYYEKTNADFIPFKKAKKKNFKLDKSFDNEEFEVGGKGKKIGKLRNILGNKVTILFDNENEEICSYALSIDYQSDLSTKVSTINYKINKKYKEYNNYYISAICFKHGIERKRSIAWIHKEYKRIKELNKEEKAVKESTLVNISDDERIVTERYIGRSQTLQQTVNKHFREAGDDIITELLTEKTEIALKLESAFDLPTEKVVALENRLKYLDNQIKDVETYVSEAANIEKEMKPIIEQLNAKGYKTKYSSPGHTQLRKKEDVFRDGIYEGKLYSDARIMFDGDYNFPKAPKYWIWRTVEGNDYLDVDPKAYSFEKGFTPSEMFNKWKAAYMGTLKTWVENLPDQSETKNSPIVKDTKGRETVVESGDIDQIFEDFFKESMNDIDLDLMELGVESVYTEKKRLGKPELSYK